VQLLQLFVSMLLKRFFLFSAHIKDAVETDCTKCSAAQKRGADKVIVFLYKNKRDKYKALQEKYDPGNTYYTKHESSFKD
jgi:hypothetical protein